MKRNYSSRSRYRVEELVDAAYKEARLVTRNRMRVAILVSRMLEDWLANSNRPDLVSLLQTM